MTRFNIRINTLLKPLMALVLGVTEKRAYVELGDDSLTARYGWFSETIALSSILSVEKMAWPLYYGLGLRVAPGLTLGYVADLDCVVSLSLRDKLPAICGLGFSKLAMSLEEPDAFMAALHARLGARAA